VSRLRRSEESERISVRPVRPLAPMAQITNGRYGRERCSTPAPRCEQGCQRVALDAGRRTRPEVDKADERVAVEAAELRVELEPRGPVVQPYQCVSDRVDRERLTRLVMSCSRPASLIALTSA
jgi:hypothetical protein